MRKKKPNVFSDVCVCVRTYKTCRTSKMYCLCKVEKCRVNVKENGNETTLRDSKPAGIECKRKKKKRLTQEIK